MLIENRSSASIGLCADEGSPLAVRLVDALAPRGFRIERLGLRTRPPAGLSAAVFLLEHVFAIDALSSAVDRAQVPTLVVAANAELASSALPLLDARDDLALATDTTEAIAWRLRRAIAQSLHAARLSSEVDSLTGLLSRRGVKERVREAVGSMGPDEVAGVLMLDLDRFKLINDQLGHSVGDRVLASVAAHLRSSLAPADLVVRYDGDEFMCLLIRYDRASIIRGCERLLESIAALELPELRDGDAVERITASAGLSFVRPDVALESLVQEADLAMYEAKHGGKNRLVIHGDLLRTTHRTSGDLQVRHFENVTRVATDRLVAMITQMSRRLVDAARQEANLDALTGLYNRRYFDARLSREIESARAQGRALSLALIDIDHFHDINMTHGWPTGDRVLQTFATAVQGHVRVTDWVARYGGEEFVIVMQDTALAAAADATERVRRAFAEIATDSVEGRPVTATFSAGVAQYADATASPIDFVQQAAKRLLAAKAAGRNRTEPSG
jgi:two-component system cell cycle response regulator